MSIRSEAEDILESAKSLVVNDEKSFEKAKELIDKCKKLLAETKESKETEPSMVSAIRSARRYLDVAINFISKSTESYESAVSKMKAKEKELSEKRKVNEEKVKERQKAFLERQKQHIVSAAKKEAEINKIKQEAVSGKK